MRAKVIAKRVAKGICFGMALLAATTRPSLAQDKEVLEEARASYQDLLSSLKTMVDIDTGNSDQDGIKRFVDHISTELKALGATVEVRSSGDPLPGLNLIGKLHGTGKRKILLLAHMDTVFKVGTAQRRPFRIEGDRAYGPGVGDCKGGIALALSAFKIINKLHFEDFAEITLLLNYDEEKGSFGSRDLIMEEGLKHDFALALEAGSPEDAIVTSHKGIGYFKIEAFGKAAHAGVEPQNGRNAILELSHQVVELSKTARPEIGTTVNFTLMDGGERHNIIPDYAYAQADVRSYFPDEFNRLETEFGTITQDKLIPDVVLSWKLVRGRPPFPKNAKTALLAKKLQAIYTDELGKKLVAKGTGGAGDINYVVSAGGVGVDSLGIVGGKLHTKDEYIELQSVVPRLYLLTRALMTLSL